MVHINNKLMLTMIRKNDTSPSGTGMRYGTIMLLGLFIVLSYTSMMSSVKAHTIEEKKMLSLSVNSNKRNLRIEDSAIPIDTKSSHQVGGHLPITVNELDVLKSKHYHSEGKKYNCPNYQYTTGEWKRSSSSHVYKWIPTSDECTLTPWSTQSLCDVLNGRNILLVGDSVNGNLYHAFIHAFNITKGNNDIIQFVNNHTIPVQQTAAICKKSELTFIRNDWLTIDKVIPDVITGHNVWTPWLHVLKYHEVVILNTGAHSRPIKDYRAAFRRLDEYLIEHYNGTVIYRTTPRGHINCSVTDVEPIRSTVNNTDWDRFFNSPPTDSQFKYKLYNYGLFPEFNSIMKTYAKSPHIVLDVAPIMELRPDVHNPPNDCLHVRPEAESSLDIWLQLILNALEGNLENE